ncbi:MAG TPA: hypothetical protein VH142_22975 [Polyangiaceae bacterium]|nr:hypothetical protein [Polyangiaceae bacterium]
MPVREGDDHADSRRPRPTGQSWGKDSTPDVVEAALADALTKASAAGEWTTVAQLARELEARREARVGVVKLDTARKRRER